MSKNVLILASVASMIDQFNRLNIKVLQELGYNVNVACNFEVGNTCSKKQVQKLKTYLTRKKIIYYQVDFLRNPLNIKENIAAYRQVEKIVRIKVFDFLHCHSPIGGLVGRLVAKLNNIKVIYTAHGFHFYKGAPLLNWLIFYPIEKWLARYTDVLITINKEDYHRAKCRFKAKYIERIPGIGLDVFQIKSIKVDRNLKRKEIGLPLKAFLILSVGELNENKNHEIIIRAIARLKNLNIHYAVCGAGRLDKYLMTLSRQLGVQSNVHLLGFRNDVLEIYRVSDLFAFPSLREGLGMSSLEAMASGLPLLTSNVHGIVDYSINEKTGFSCDPNDVESFAKYIKLLYENNEMRLQMSLNNKTEVVKFDKTIVHKKMKNIYSAISEQ